MRNRDGFLTRWLTTAPDWLFVSYAIVASFSTYFCMYAFRKPFAAATYDGLDTFVGLTERLFQKLVGRGICRKTTEVSDWTPTAMLTLSGGIGAGLCVSESPYVFPESGPARGTGQNSRRRASSIQRILGRRSKRSACLAESPLPSVPCSGTAYSPGSEALLY